MRQRIIACSLVVAMIMGSLAGCGGSKCAVSNCNNKVYKEGLCADHYIEMKNMENGTAVSGAGNESKTKNTATPVEYEYFTYTDAEGKESIKLTALKDKDYKGDVVIPDSIDGLSVTALEGTFEECAGITSVTIPDSVTIIGKDAFCYCTGLTSVTIPDSVTEIGESAFGACKSLTSITIPNSVTMIGNLAFSSCDSLTSITIPDSVKYIFRCAFSGCTRLTSVTFPDTKVNLDMTAFFQCTNVILKVHRGSQMAEWFKENDIYVEYID